MITSKKDTKFGIKKGKTTPEQRILIYLLFTTGHSLKEIKKICKESLGIDIKESSIRTWTNFFYKIVRYEQNRNRYK